MPNNQNIEDETSPLIDPPRSSHDSDADAGRPSNPSRRSNHDWKLEDPVIKDKSTLYLILLTLSIGGLQIVWSIELSNGSPYLLSLGMSKALLAFVWLAGPTTGVLVQPYIGMLSDRCRIAIGKRKPFMIAGTLGTVVSSLLLAYARQIVQIIGGWDFDAPYQGWWQGVTIAFATVMMWVLDFSINTVQAAIRAFIVDGAPAHQQETANAWAGRVTGIGNVFGYIAGYLDLPKHFKFLGREQFQVLCAFASIVLSTTVLISVVTIRERNPQDDPPGKDDHHTGIVTFSKNIWQSIKRLPDPVRRVCEIQFCHWMGWFPFLYYTTTYIGQLYVDPRLDPSMSSEDVDKLWARATRIGTFALLVEAIVSLSSNILLPFLIVPTYKAAVTTSRDAALPSSPTTVRADASGLSHEQRGAVKRVSSTFSADIGLHSETGQMAAKPVPPFAQRFLELLQIPGFTLRRAWLLSQLLFSLCMFSTFFISTPLVATIMVALVGVSWSLTLWAPFALISGDISRRDEARRAKQRRKLLTGDPDAFDHDGDDEEEEDRAGIVLGLHNVAVSAPQIIATLISSAVFKLLQKPRTTPGDVSVAWTLRLGGIAGLVAAFLTYRMEEVNQEVEEG